MKTFRSKSTTTYKRYTPVQLASTIRQLQKQCISASKTPTWKTVRGKTPVQQCTKIVSEIKKVATVLRFKTVQQINAKIRTLKTQMASNLGVKVSSPKASSPAVKRLKAKVTKINQCRRVSTLIKLCTGVKLSTFKNPKVRNVARKTTRSKGKRRTQGTRRTKTTRRTKSKRKTSKRKSTTGHVKYKKIAKTLKKELHKLKRRNSFMRRLVNQFRKKAAKLQRAYRARHAQPRWRVIKNRSSSNVVRLHRTPTWNRSTQRQRRVG